MSIGSVAGHYKAKLILKGFIKKKALPHALLFVGDSGVGKLLMGLNFAKALNCLNPTGFDSCDVCSSCKKIVSYTHPDVHVITSSNKYLDEEILEGIQNEITIDVVRKITEILSKKAFEGKVKVFIIDDADKMNVNAANAFLKTLEEPPENTLIILISTNADAIKDTIRSRCMRIIFNPLSKYDMAAIIKANTVKTSQLFQGRPGLVLSDVARYEEKFFDTIKAVLKCDPSSVWSDKDEMKWWASYCMVFLRDIAVSIISDNVQPLLMQRTLDDIDYEQVSVEKISALFNEVMDYSSKIDLNLNKNIAWNYLHETITSVLKQV